MRTRKVILTEKQIIVASTKPIKTNTEEYKDLKKNKTLIKTSMFGCKKEVVYNHIISKENV